MLAFTQVRSLWALGQPSSLCPAPASSPPPTASQSLTPPPGVPGGPEVHQSPLCPWLMGWGIQAIRSPLLTRAICLLQKHVVETFFGFDEESVDSETLSETSCNTDRTDRAPITPEEDLDDVSGPRPPGGRVWGTSGLWRLWASLPRCETGTPKELGDHSPQCPGEAVSTFTGSERGDGDGGGTWGPLSFPSVDFTEELCGGCAPPTLGH